MARQFLRQSALTQQKVLKNYMQILIREDNTQFLQRSQRSNKGIPPKRYDQNMMIIADHEINNEWYDVHNEPSSIHEALNCNDRNEWKKAIENEKNVVLVKFCATEHQNETTTILTYIQSQRWKQRLIRPEGANVIKTKWLFKRKYGKNSDVEKYKARLVAKGCAQIYGVDYFETYSPVVKLTTIRILIAVAVERNMLLHQMDISNAFLNGKLEENIFMEQPEGFIINPNKQSPRCWNNTLTEYLKNNGFAESNSDPCLFIRNDNKFMIIAVYVDDLIIASKNQDDLVHMKTELGMRFKAKDYNELNYCLGIEINIHEDNIELQQTNFIQRVLNKYQMAECKIVSTPMNPNIRLEVNDNTSKSVDQKLYQFIIGSLLYIAICTRPDIAYAVEILSRFNISPNDLHLTAAKQVLRYLRGTKDFRLRFVYTGKLTLQGYCDADLANNADDRTSTSGNIFILANAPVSWISCKQRIVALLSTAEAEYVALSVATQEVQWLRQVLADIGEQCNEPTTIFEDNQPAIAIASGKTEHKRTKHIDIKFHFVRASIQQRIVKLEYCTTNEMLADIMTKPLNKEKIQYFRNEFGHKSSIMEEYQTRGNVVKEAFGIHYTLSDFHWASFAM
ncbi:hypothetical protein GJ496_011917 [Pomphorhynchus laevis]|nr:hypothetical protein GJ496_011917 [Pomphorhynchus laevis]